MKGRRNILMDLSSILFTAINALFTLVSVICAVYSARQTKFQTNIMRQQLEESQKPDFALTGRLEGISRAIYKVEGAIKNLADK